MRTSQRVVILRNERAPAHQDAIDDEDAEALLGELVVTSVTIANLWRWEFGIDPAYDHEQTIPYLRVVAKQNIRSKNNGLGSATSAAFFGTREIARQNSDAPVKQDTRNWVLRWQHNTAGDARQEHVAADGLTVAIDDDFGISPGMGAKGCACTANLEDERRSSGPQNPRVVGKNTSDITPAQLNELKANLAKAHADISKDLGISSRWKGTVRVGQEANVHVRSGSAGGSKDWTCQISITEEWANYNLEQRTMLEVHEMAHSFSQATKKTFLRWRPLEEGVVEGYARSVTHAYQPWAYQTWVEQLGTWRGAAALQNPKWFSGTEWFKSLMKIPLKDRAKWIAKESGRPLREVMESFGVT